jgi:hypothetical protein
MEFAISTFCFGERYYHQTNRMIKSFKGIEDIPNIFVVTDKPELIDKENFVFVKNVSEYDPLYLNYEKNYYDFDFSVKRFSLKFALDSGYSKIILTDTDVIVNQDKFTTQSVLSNFISNSLAGQVVYSYQENVNNNSQLGKRFNHYEKHFGVNFEKSNLWMPEDCVQYLDIEPEKFHKFLSTWDECINIKKRDKLHNIPAGNIDEMCFSALYNDIDIQNNSNRSINLLIALHDKWY